MRIATANAYDNTIAHLQKRQQELAESQVRLTSNKRVLRASDDPTAAARAERALAAAQRAQVSQRAVDASRNAMTLAESALGDAVDMLQAVRDSLVAAGNATYTDAERKSIAEQLQQYRDQLLSIANRSDGAGTYLFSGQGTLGQPFVDAPGGVQYRGVGGAASVASDEALPMTVDGHYAWMTAPSGNGVFETRAVTSLGSAWIDAGRVTDPAAILDRGYDIDFSVTGGTTTWSIQRRNPDGTPDGAPVTGTYESGKAIEIDGMSFTISGAPADGDRFSIEPSTGSLSVFDVLDRVIAGLKQPGAGSGQVTQTVNDGLRDVDSLLVRMQSVRSAVGDTLNRADAVSDRLGETELQAKTERSNAEDLDLVEGISDFQTRQTGYDAALKTYAQVQRLSLFQYLG
ncbi:flagellar hook-associated protein FlgL [Caldimonas thermodepolymerans]|jgi:flagellar hook-associated protein 3|uniref:Flagellar hook-associated protein 3 n=1 Tax=Caldimonas thermodepolymerans TaxID=215580 RepID=A0A2S5TA47_9BURK|nr:flagellar hook-associated protein FlgL [Caldimonas thermodepolymerans]PPE71728.1 flagellar hook-associated protein 3 [Caldimonas thermodepolymerans]QPC30754.1 flagellar hook-associated protein FlgL [Caldimonas thermodepolymerans]RDI02627.1 flagellar hook-associated protein 3 FlgL [Caldimonas thermodepolymerans]TCP08845.1 flagellar hook-associated protein 3 FlgL [Caldimonas thermodepolymerans]UZG43495.1 flagellar hook-associated protein FlgL [Caldimonas thermodepolymerans]